MPKSVNHTGTFVPVRISFEKALRIKSEEECQLWNISLSEFCRKSAEYVLSLPVDERRDVILPHPYTRK